MNTPLQTPAFLMHQNSFKTFWIYTTLADGTGKHPSLFSRSQPYSNKAA